MAPAGGDELGDDDSSEDESAAAARKRRREDEEAEEADVGFSLAALEAEIEALRREPPGYVHGVGALSVPSLVCGDDGKLGKPEGDGPWDLLVWVSGKEGDDAYGFPFCVRLRFDPDLWPQLFPIVRFQGVFHHALIDDDGNDPAVMVQLESGRKVQLSSTNGMMKPFYAALARDSRNLCTVSLTLRAVHEFLVDPVACCKLQSLASKARLQASVQAHRQLNADRMDVVQKYSKLRRHAELFASPTEWRQEWFHPGFWRASQSSDPAAWRELLSEHLAGEVFSFPIFTDAFCQVLLDEIFNFYGCGLPARRPNSMNAYGIILNEIGLEPFINRLQRALQPLGELLWPGPGSVWDGHHCFIVRYREGEDLGLDMHTDDSDVTFNVCLGLEFDGAGLQFCGHMGAPNHRKHTYTYKHVKGTCVVHLGRKRHGADDITSGERMNLILWNHSSTYRQSKEYQKPGYEAEEAPPDPVCVSYTHDRDFGNFRAYPTGKEKFKGCGWCPRPRFEYEGFKPDCDKEAKCGSCHDSD